MNSEQDILLTWLQKQLAEARKARDKAKGSDMEHFHNGRIDNMLNVIAFVQTGGKLR